MKKTHWNTDAQPYDTTLAQVLYDIRRSDGGEGLLLDAVTAQEIFDDAEGVIAFDALVTPCAKLERRMELLRGIMERTGDKVKPVALQITDPFKQRGVANVAAIFELSDGQTVTIFFHNPDVTPNKMAPADELISWKWLLNKKDITIVVAPERGADLNIREVARRIMRLAEKNSEAFQRVNAKRAAWMQNIQTLKDDIATLEIELATAQHELEVAKVAAEDAATKPETAQAVQQKPDITYHRNSAAGLFTSFFPNTPDGEKAWNIINATPGAEGGKVLAAHAEPTIAQLREAGYTVAEQALRAFAAATNGELYDPDYSGGQWMIKAVETQETIADFVAASDKYQEATMPKFGQIAGFKFAAFSKVQVRKGDQHRELSVIDFGFARFALNTDLTNFDYQAWDSTYPDKTAAADQKEVDRALFRSVIDGTVPNILAPDLADSLEAAFNRNQGNPDMVNLFELAVGAYQNAMLAATVNLS